MKIWFDALEIQLRIKGVRVPERGAEAERERERLTFIFTSPRQEFYLDFFTAWKEEWTS